MDLSILDPTQMAAWCIVPYDSRQRSPDERASMLQSLELAGEAWDWRDEHISQFPEELDALAARGLRLFGIWVPGVLPESGPLGEIHSAVRGFVVELATRGLTVDLWTCAEFGQPGPVQVLPAAEQAAHVNRTADHLEPLVELAGENGHRVGLYNHLGWFGEPENQIEVVEALRGRGLDNVGLVYQQHHGHHHLGRWPALMKTMTPYLYALGLNGMVEGAHWGGRKIHPYGHGPRDVDLARVVVESGWDGLTTILCHTMDDAEARLRDNLEGLNWVRACLRGEEPILPEARIPEPAWPH
ncbi:MAG: hypothetical protein JW722_02860 [Demequinaceae bacterium]|nr:hypothetical protein [Demequinaceae bacterium]